MLRGNYALGAVTATWNMGDGMEVRVTRGWPNTTTYLNLIDPSMRARMKRQMKQQAARQRAAQARRQGNAL